MIRVLNEGVEILLEESLQNILISQVQFTGPWKYTSPDNTVILAECFYFLGIKEGEKIEYSNGN
jgi:hypothetical protein